MVKKTFTVENPTTEQVENNELSEKQITNEDHSIVTKLIEKPLDIKSKLNLSDVKKVHQYALDCGKIPKGSDINLFVNIWNDRTGAFGTGLDRRFYTSTVTRLKGYDSEKTEDIVKYIDSFLRGKPNDYYVRMAEDKKPEFVPSLLGDEIMNMHNFITVSVKGKKSMYVYQDGVYTPSGLEIAYRAVTAALGLRYKSSRVKDVVSYIKTKTSCGPEKFNLSNPRIVNMENGLYDVDNDTFMSHTPDLFTTIQIPVVYNPDATCPKFDKFLSEVVAPEYKQLIFEWFGYCILQDVSLQKALLLTGEGANGKSVLLDVLMEFCGKQNVSGESLQSLSENRFSTTELYGKLVNIFSDLPNQRINDLGIFKTLVGGDRIRAEPKYMAPFNFENKCALTFSCNRLPEISDGGFSFFRRLIVIPFPNTFSGKNRNEKLLEELTTPEELSGIFNKATAAIRDVFKNGNGFSYNMSTEQVAQVYQNRTSDVAKFAYDCIAEKEGARIDSEFMYKLFINWQNKAMSTEILSKKAFATRFGKLGFTKKRDSSGVYFWDGVTVEKPGIIEWYDTITDSDGNDDDQKGDFQNPLSSPEYRTKYLNDDNIKSWERTGHDMEYVISIVKNATFEKKEGFTTISEVIAEAGKQQIPEEKTREIIKRQIIRGNIAQTSSEKIYYIR